MTENEELEKRDYLPPVLRQYWDACVIAEKRNKKLKEKGEPSEGMPGICFYSDLCKEENKDE